jgi:acyl carrier protein
MKINKFKIDFKEFLEIDSIDDLTSETILRDLEEFDSFFVLTTIAFIDERFSIKLTAEDFDKIITINDLINFIGDEKLNLYD